MHAPSSPPRRLPQRVIVAGQPGVELDGFLTRLAATLDLPLVPFSDLAGPDDVARLAAFDGWVTTPGYDAARATLLARAEVVVLLEEPGTLRNLVRRTVRRMRSDATAPVDLSWVETLPMTDPEVAVVRLVGQPAATKWLADLAR